MEMGHKFGMGNSPKKQNSFVAEIIESLRALGRYKLAILTNNGFWNAKKTKTTFFDPEMDFDFVIESCKIGERKPDAAFYQVFPHQDFTSFLDYRISSIIALSPNNNPLWRVSEKC